MPPQEAGIDADGFHESILWPLDGVLHLRGIRPPVDPGFDFKSNGSGLREQHHAEAVDQLFENRLQILARLRHTVVNRSVKGFLVKLPHGLPPQVLRNGLEDILRHIPAGYQPIDGIGVNGKAAAPKLSGNKIAHLRELPPDFPVRHLIHLKSQSVRILLFLLHNVIVFYIGFREARYERH